jgi:hypothetical protein
LRHFIRSSETVSEFIKCATDIRNEWHEEDDRWGPWFRGQQRSQWGLSPKLYRDYGKHSDLQDVEDEIREEFDVRAPILSETALASGAWERYFLMQHFGAPTRLLDWTEGALIALYFAVRDNPGYWDAAVWVLDPYGLNGRVIGREEVICPSESSATKRDLKRVAPWLPIKFGQGPKIPRAPLAVYPTHTVRRISSQRSCFTVHGTDAAGLDRLRRSGHVLKVVIPSHSISTMRRERD